MRSLAVFAILASVFAQPSPGAAYGSGNGNGNGDAVRLLQGEASDIIAGARALLVASPGNSCPSGYVKLAAEAECWAAAQRIDDHNLLPDASETSFQGKERANDWPAGCYHCDNVPDCTNGIWWNKDKTGAANGDATPLCGGCVDAPGTSGEEWTDGDNTCHTYEVNNWCSDYGGTDWMDQGMRDFVLVEGSANEKCCVCGGGGDVCVDLPGASSGSTWTDGNWDCDTYDETDGCDAYGGTDYNGEGAAKDHCCACGGGDTGEGSDTNGGDGNFMLPINGLSCQNQCEFLQDDEACKAVSQIEEAGGPVHSALCFKLDDMINCEDICNQIDDCVAVSMRRHDLLLDAAFIVHEGVGWCSSHLDKRMWDGYISELGDKTADDCWSDCQASFGAREPRHEFWNDGWETWCYCLDGCQCMEDVGASSSLAPPDWVPPSGCASDWEPPKEEYGYCLLLADECTSTGVWGNGKEYYVKDPTVSPAVHITCGDRRLLAELEDSDDEDDKYDIDSAHIDSNDEMEFGSDEE